MKHIFKARKTKHLIEESIMLAIDYLSNNIQTSINEENNNIDAKSIKILAEAYDIVHRGKKANEI